MDIEKVVSSITGDGKLVEEFKKSPVETVKKKVGDSVPKDVIDKIVAAVKAKLEGGKLAGIADKIGGLFNK